MGKRSIILVTIALVSLISILLWAKRHNISSEGLALKILSLTERDPPRFGFGNEFTGVIPSHELWDRVVKEYVDNEGWVDYKSLQKEPKILDEYLALLSSHPPNKNWSKEEELAYWINAYNAFTVKVILKNYPISSIKDIGGSIPMHTTVWDERFFQIGDRKMSLGDIEHRVLRQHYHEPRIHFAINCASVSCPALRREAFTSNRMEEQLEEQTISFLADANKNDLSASKVARLSPIFRWFSEDFGSKSELTSLLNKYSSSEYSSDTKLEYMDYNWSLNE